MKKKCFNIFIVKKLMKRELKALMKRKKFKCLLMKLMQRKPRSQTKHYVFI